MSMKIKLDQVQKAAAEARKKNSPVGDLVAQTEIFAMANGIQRKIEELADNRRWGGVATELREHLPESEVQELIGGYKKLSREPRYSTARERNAKNVVRLLAKAISTKRKVTLPKATHSFKPSVAVQLQDAQEKITNLEAESARVKAISEHLRQRRDELEKQLAAGQAPSTLGTPDRLDAIAALDDEIVKLAEEIDALKSKIVQHEEHISFLEKENSELLAKKAEVSGQLDIAIDGFIDTLEALQNAYESGDTGRVKEIGAQNKERILKEIGPALEKLEELLAKK